MRPPRRILLLHPAEARGVEAVEQALRDEGATVRVCPMGGDYDALLDEIAAAETVVYWP